MRLIDADAPMKHFATSHALVNDRDVLYCNGVLDVIERESAVDAVPVVRCKDCEKFWEYTEEHKATVEKADGDCAIRCIFAPDGTQFCAVQKDDYCSMGKRKGAKMDGGAADAKD